MNSEASDGGCDTDDTGRVGRACGEGGVSRPAEGIRRLIRLLVRKYKSLGGELRLRSGVKSIRSFSVNQLSTSPIVCVDSCGCRC